MPSGRRLRGLRSQLAVAAAESEVPAEMSDREKFMLDLQGYLVVEDVLSREEVAALNAALDANWEKRSVGADSGKRKGYSQMHGMLEWPAEHSQPFRDLLAHRRVCARAAITQGVLTFSTIYTATIQIYTVY